MQIVDSWTDIDLENHVFLNMVDEINSLIAPLIKYFCLDTFSYFKTYNDDSQIRLTNKPDWVRHYISNKLYLQSIFELSARNYSKNRIIVSNINSHNVINKEAIKFGIAYVITFVEPVEDGCEFYFLGTSSNNIAVINKYLSNFYLLEKFVTYFHEAGKSIIARAESHRVIARDWKQNNLTFSGANLIDKFGFLNSLYDYKFTNRELECVPLLLKGLSAKQIAEDLKISFRTVEIYINNLKHKTNTTNKNELLSLLYEKFG